jgi:hypothetical protein
MEVIVRRALSGGDYLEGHRRRAVHRVPCG